MSTIEERLSAIETKLADMDRHAPERSRLEADLIEAARQFARVVKLNYCVNIVDGKYVLNRLEESTVPYYRRVFEERMRSIAFELIRLEAS